MSPFRVAGVSITLLIAGGCAGGGTSINLQPGAIYTSRPDNFTVMVPSMAGTTFHETETANDSVAAGVTFSDDFGVLLDVQSRHLSDDQIARYTLPNRTATLQADFDQQVLPGLKQLSTGATVLHREPVETTVGPAVFAVVGLPGGSTLTTIDAAGNPVIADGKPVHPDGVRGVLLFAKLRWTYTVTVQLWPATTNGPKLSQDDVNARLLSDLRHAVAGMTFKS